MRRDGAAAIGKNSPPGAMHERNSPPDAGIGGAPSAPAAPTGRAILMRILHVLDHSPPRASNYTRRVMAILRQQRALGWQTCHLTGPGQGEHGGAADSAAGAGAHWHFYRTPAASGRATALPLLGAVNAMAARLQQVVQLTRPDLLHAHSPLENALAALRVGRRNGLPVVFEAHAPGPAAAPGAIWCASGGSAGRQAQHRSTARLALPPSWSHFALRALEAWAAARAGAVVTNSDGMRARLQACGVRPGHITLVADGLDPARYAPHPGLAAQASAGPPPLSSFLSQRAAPFDPPGAALRESPWMPPWRQIQGGVPNRRRAPRQGGAWVLGDPGKGASMFGAEVGGERAEGAALIGYSFGGDAAAGHDCALLLSAFAALLRGWPATRLLVACNPVQAQELDQLARRHGLAGQVSLLIRAGAEAHRSAAAPLVCRSGISAAPTAALHRMADIVVFPQAAPLSSPVAAPPRRLLEAMARACVVAAADTPAQRALIDHGRSGVLFAAADAAALADALGVLLAGRGRWPALRAGARWFIEYQRSWEVCVARYGPVYEQLLDGRRRR